MLKFKSYRYAFTLIELMIVVLIVGVLAAVAVPSYYQYVANTRMAEAYELTNVISKSEITYFLDHKKFVSAESNPIVSIQNGFQDNTVGGYTGWSKIGYPVALGTKTYFMYEVYAGSGADGRTLADNELAGAFNDTQSLYSINTGVDEIVNICTNGAGGTVPSSLTSITAASLGIAQPVSGTYEWAIVSAMGNPRYDKSCAIVISMIEAGSLLTQDIPKRRANILFTIDFEN